MKQSNSRDTTRARNRRDIAHGIKLRPLSSAVLLCLVSGQLAAQSAAPEAPAKAEEIVITGSRIRGVAPVGSEVVAVSRFDIESSGAVTTAQVLQQVPQIYNLGVSENSRGQPGGSGNITYGSSVNIRGIGPFATLTLINGHRTVGQGTTGAAVDPSVIPTLALERVEVVPDGASAIYGSDAIAGVANLIMRRNENGAQGFVRYGKADGYDESQAGALWGKTWAGGQVTLTFENDKKSALSGRDRNFFTGNLLAQGGGNFLSTQCNPGNIVISGVTYPIPAGGVTPATASKLVAGSANQCDNIKLQDLVPQQERNSAAFTFNQKLGGDFSVYGDGFVTRRDYTFRPGALASTLTVPQTNAFYVRPAGAPAGTSETVSYSFVNDLPVNTAKGYSQTAQATVGADRDFANGWKAGALFTYGRNYDIAVTLHALNPAAITTALASNSPATALNPFGSGATPGAVLDSISNVVSYSPGETRFKNLQAKADGPLYQLPGGMMRAAFGYEGQHIETIGGQTNGPAPTAVKAEVTMQRTINSVYGELLVPIVGKGNAMTGIQLLDLSLAERSDRYDDVGSTNNPKIGLNWSPAKGLTFHGTYGTSFRAPGLTNLHTLTSGGKGGLFVQNYSDPTIGGALRVGVAMSGSNPVLKPETATTKTLGFDWEPEIGTKTKISVSYFDILYENQISSVLSDLTILNRESQFAGTGIIQRNPSPALVAQLIANVPLNSGVLPSTWTLFVDGSNYNLGKSLSRGFDFLASTRIPTATMGSFVLGVNGTVFTKYLVAATANAPYVDQLNNIYNPLRFKARFSGSWSQGPIYANLYLNYQNAYKNNLANPVQTVGANTTLDGRIAYALEDRADMLKDTTVALGVVNLFNRAPPFVNIAQSTNGGGGFDPTLVSPVGRIVSVSLDKKF